MLVYNCFHLVRQLLQHHSVVIKDVLLTHRGRQLTHVYGRFYSADVQSCVTRLLIEVATCAQDPAVTQDLRQVVRVINSAAGSSRWPLWLVREAVHADTRHVKMGEVAQYAGVKVCGHASCGGKEARRALFTQCLHCRKWYCSRQCQLAAKSQCAQAESVTPLAFTRFQR